MTLAPVLPKRSTICLAFQWLKYHSQLKIEPQIEKIPAAMSTIPIKISKIYPIIFVIIRAAPTPKSNRPMSA